MRYVLLFLFILLPVVSMIFFVGTGKSWQVSDSAPTYEYKQQQEMVQTAEELSGSDFKQLASGTPLTIGNITIEMEIADTPESRMQGLSGRESLFKNTGLLFIFEREWRHRFWMKEMHFPIDIIWLDTDGVVVDIKKDVQPASYPEVFEPRTSARYVLEVNAGFSEKNGVKIGSTSTLPFSTEND